MEPDTPEHLPDGSVSIEVDAPDGVPYELRVWRLKEENVSYVPVHGFRFFGAGSPPRGHQRFMAAVSPAGGGLVIA